MKDKDLEFIASRNLDFKKIEKWLIDMWLNQKNMFKWKQLCDYYHYGFCKNPNGCKCKKDCKEFYKPKKRLSYPFK